MTLWEMIGEQLSDNYDNGCELSALLSGIGIEKIKELLGIKIVIYNE